MKKPIRITISMFGPWLGTLLLTVFTAPLSGHDFQLTQSQLHLGSERFLVRMTCDLDALALGVSQEVDSAQLKERLTSLPQDQLKERIADLRTLFQRRVRVRFDGEPADFEVEFPEHGTAADVSQEPTLLGTTAILKGRIPPQAEEVSFFASRAFPPVRLEVYRTTDDVLSRPGFAGFSADSSSQAEPPSEGPSEAGQDAPREGAPATVLLLQRGARSDPLPLRAEIPAAGTLEVAGRYLVLGFWHIVPEGLDHILFVLGLFLLSTRLRPLLLQVTAFTAAHTLTLALSIYGVVSLPSRPVETLIALSIVYVAVENLLTTELKPWRVGVVFTFGLLHGLGFAGVLRELGLPESEYLPALLSFNVGVELGQLAVILMAFAAVGWMRRRDSYRSSIVIPGSLGIALLGGYWAVQRMLG
ncbi:MAG TPA: HupE/UreJ family protein [Acidobacteriota bacterium]|nr:HupE/UreJ family protein [Acidobacteriota bacterium]